MKQNDKFNAVLSECLDRILRGETVEQCLRSFPEQAKELEPLLHTAVTAKTASTIQPRAEFKARARYEFQSALQDMKTGKSQRRPFFAWHWQWQSGWAIALIIVAVVVIGGGGTVVASRNSMPDSPFYSVKLATEQVQLALTRSDISKAELNAQFAGRRAAEVLYLASKGNVQEVQILAQRLNTNLENITGLTGNLAGHEASPSSAPSGANSTPAAQNDQRAMGGAGAAAPQATVAGPLQVAPAPPPMLQSVPAPATSPVPMPAIKAAPSPEAVPSFSNAQVPTTNAPPAPQSRETIQNSQNTGQANKEKALEQEKLKQILISNFNTLQSRLEEALNVASPDVRPAIRQAIARSQAEYEKALKNIAAAENMN